LPIEFHFDISKFNLPQNSIKKWIEKCIVFYNFKLGDINIIFIPIKDMIYLNNKYLNHNYVTDILTFNYNNKSIISGDIYICVEQVKINAVEYNVAFVNEIKRVIIHGILHLIGFDDVNSNLRVTMRKEEDYWLKKF